MNRLSPFYPSARVAAVRAIQTWMRHECRDYAPHQLLVVLEPLSTLTTITTALHQRIVSVLTSKTDVAQPYIIVCRPGHLPVVLSQRKSFLITEDSGNWQRIFASSELEVWERSFQKNEIKPLRYGVTDKEKLLLLRLARRFLVAEHDEFEKSNFKVLLHSWQEQEKISDRFIERFSQPTTLDVSLWVNGHLSGSQVVENQPALEALYEGVRRAKFDIRFRPVVPNEYQFTRIEIVLLSNLFVPLSSAELKRNEIYPEKAYRITTTEKQGWFVPAVFNCRNFYNLEQLLKSLRAEKLPNHPRVTDLDVAVAEVIDWIEGPDQQTVLSLRGPMVPYEAVPADVLSDDWLELEMRQVLDWCTRVQAADGSFPATIPLFSFAAHRVDWIRSGFLLYVMGQALEVFPSLKKNAHYTSLVDWGYHYLQTHLYTHQTMGATQRCASMLYYNHLARLRSDTREIGKSHQMILSLVSQIVYDPIIVMQLATYMHQYGSLEDVALRQRARQYIEEVWIDFVQKKDTKKLDLASYVDLPEALTHQGLKDKLATTDTPADILTWYTEQQKEDGSFPAFPGSSYAYTRGTAKILEVLIKRGVLNDGALRRGLLWLKSMQYKEGELYFVRPEIQSKILGGLRHDFHDTTIWIDSVAHYGAVLLACHQSKKKLKTDQYIRYLNGAAQGVGVI